MILYCAYAGTGAMPPCFSCTKRLVANSACCYRIGDGAQTATTADTYLPANVIEHVIVSPGQRISAIKAATNGLVTATAGTLWVTEMS